MNALSALAIMDERQGRVVELRLFGGLNVDERPKCPVSLPTLFSATGRWPKSGRCGKSNAKTSNALYGTKI